MPSSTTRSSEPTTPLSPASDDGPRVPDRPSLPRTWTDLEPHTGGNSVRSSRARVSFRLSLFKSDCPPSLASPTTPRMPTTPTRTASTPSKRLSTVAPALWRKVSAPASPVRAQGTVDPRHARHVLICPVHAVPALLRAPNIDPRALLGPVSCEEEGGCACPAFACAVSLSARRGCAAACPALRLRRVDFDDGDDGEGWSMEDRQDVPRGIRSALKIPRTPLSMEMTDVLDVLGRVDDLDARVYEYGLALPVPTVRIVPFPVDAAVMARATAEMGKITAQRVVLFTELAKCGAGMAAAQVRVPYELEAESIVVNVAAPKSETEEPRFEIDPCDVQGEGHHALHVWAPPLAITSASVFIHIFDPAWRRARLSRTDVPPTAGGILDDIVWNAAHALRDRHFVFVGIDALPPKALRRKGRRHTNAADSPVSPTSATSAIAATTAITPAQAVTPTTPGFPPTTPTTPHLPDAAAHPNARTLLAAIFDLTVRVLRDAPHVPGKIHPRAVWTDERIAALVAKRVTFYTMDEYRAAVGETTWRVHTVGYPWHQPQGA